MNNPNRNNSGIVETVYLNNGTQIEITRIEDIVNFQYPDRLTNVKMLAMARSS